MTDKLTKAEVQSFTSWKMDVLDAMSCDPSVTEMDFRVAVRLLQHLNARTRQAHPSLERLAAQCGVSRDTAMRSLARLCNPKGGCHWLNRWRPDRIHPYIYNVVMDRLSMVMDGKIDREERARDIATQKRNKRYEVANHTPDEVAAVQPREVANDRGDEVANEAVHEVAAVQPKHLRKNYLSRTPFNNSNEEEDSFVEGTDSAFIPPDNPDDARVWLYRLCTDKTQIADALVLLAQGKLTPEIVKELAA